jgi:hypothetical protein
MLKKIYRTRPKKEMRLVFKFFKGSNVKSGFIAFDADLRWLNNVSCVRLFEAVMEEEE